MIEQILIKHLYRLFLERVKPVEGALDFLLAAGFLEQLCETPEGQENYLVFQNSPEAISNLDVCNSTYTF